MNLHKFLCSLYCVFPTVDEYCTATFNVSEKGHFFNYPSKKFTLFFSDTLGFTVKFFKNILVLMVTSAFVCFPRNHRKFQRNIEMHCLQLQFVLSQVTFHISVVSIKCFEQFSLGAFKFLELANNFYSVVF